MSIFGRRTFVRFLAAMPLWSSSVSAPNESLTASVEQFLAANPSDLERLDVLWPARLQLTFAMQFDAEGSTIKDPGKAGA